MDTSKSLSEMGRKLYRLAESSLWAQSLNFFFEKKKKKIESEAAFATHLMQTYSKSPLLNLNLFLLNSRGSPWFNPPLLSPSHLSPDPGSPPLLASPVEDQSILGLYVSSVDPDSKIIELTCEPKRKGSMDDVAQDPGTVSLFRREHLSRFEWCLKGCFEAQYTPALTLKSIQETTPIASGSTFTLVSIDTQLDPPRRHPTSSSNGSLSATVDDKDIRCLSTFELQVFYRLAEQIPENPDRHLSQLDVCIHKVRASYSYLFHSIIQSFGPTHDSSQLKPQRISVFSKEKIQKLVETAKKVNLEWQEKYWTFDLVLHYLLEGHLSDVQSVIDFLVEHKKHSKSREEEKRMARKGIRFYPAPLAN